MKITGNREMMVHLHSHEVGVGETVGIGRTAKPRGREGQEEDKAPSKDKRVAKDGVQPLQRRVHCEK